jgi:hypothetical protein
MRANDHSVLGQCLRARREIPGPSRQRSRFTPPVENGSKLLEGLGSVARKRGAFSDRATFAYVSDVFVDPEHRGTAADAHGLYARYGFTSLAVPQRYMERRDTEVYARMADMAEDLEG